jgi:hypothetical protein
MGFEPAIWHMNSLYYHLIPVKLSDREYKDLFNHALA